MEEFSDEELIEHYRSEPGTSRRNSFLNQLFQRHHARVASWCLRMTDDVNSAADLAQEVFLKAFQRIDTFRGESKFTTWLYSIARHHCLDELRSRAARPEEIVDTEADQIEDPGAEAISTVIERRQSQQIVRELIRGSLDETENKVMTLHYVHELPLDSITTLLGLTNPSGAKAHVVSARRKLSRAIARWKSREEGLKGSGRAG